MNDYQELIATMINKYFNTLPLSNKSQVAQTRRVMLFNMANDFAHVFNDDGDTFDKALFLEKCGVYN